MDQRRLTISCRVAIFWVVLGLSSDFEKSDRIFQIGHDLSRNEVKWEFHSKRSKVSLLG